MKKNNKIFADKLSKKLINLKNKVYKKTKTSKN